MDTSLFFSQEPPRPFEWLRPSVSTLLQPSAFSSVLDVWLFINVNKRPHGVSTLLHPSAFSSELDVWLFITVNKRPHGVRTLQPPAFSITRLVIYDCK